jgi:hypothetical protein
MAILGLVAMFVLPVASGLATIGDVLSDPNPLALALFLLPTAMSIAILTLLVAGLLARSRFAHAAAVVILGCLLAGYGYQLASNQTVDPLSVLGIVIGATTLVALALDRPRYWPSSSTRPVPGVDIRASALLYVILTIAALSMSVLVFYHATIGQLAYMDNPAARPPGWMIVAAALSVLAIAGGGALLGAHAVVGSILSGIGLAVTAAFAGSYRPEDDIAAQVFKLGVIALAVAGMALLALRPLRDKPIG